MEKIVRFRADVRNDWTGERSFPIQMTTPDMAAEWRRCYAEQDPATEEERRWVEDNAGLIVTVLRKFPPMRTMRGDDMIAFAFPIAVRALRYYDESRGWTKNTYVTKAIRREVVKHSRCYSGFFRGKKGNSRVAGAPTSAVLLGGRTSLEVQTSREDSQAPQKILDRVARAFAELPPRHRRILAMWLGLSGNRFTVHQLARREKVTPQRISQITTISLRKVAACAGLLEFYKNRQK